MPDLRLADGTLHYAEAGHGTPALLFIHGALCRHRDWRHQLSHFSSARRVVAPDLRSHGASTRTPGRTGVTAMAADLLRLMDALALGPVVLVAHSMGCRVALQLWRDNPAKVAALVFVDGAYLVTAPLGTIDDRQRAALADEAQARAAAPFAAGTVAKRVRQGFARMFFDERFERERDEVVAHAAELPEFVARELMPDFARWDVLHMEHALASLSVPVLVLASTRMDGRRERRPLQPGESTPWLDAVSALVPHAEIRRYHGRGHFLMLEVPGKVNRAIEEFMARHGRG